MSFNIWQARFLQGAVGKIKELKYALAFAGIAAAMAVAAIALKGHLAGIAGVVIAVIMGIALMIAMLMFAAMGRAKGQAARPFNRLYFALACVFAVVVMGAALLSLSSVFFHWPLDLRDARENEPLFLDDYRVEESVVLMDLRQRIATAGIAGVESRDLKLRTDRVIRQRTTDTSYVLQSGTNGLRIDDIISETHPSMATEEVHSGRFAQTTKKTYLHSISADRFPIGETVTVEVGGVFINAFGGEDEEWAGVCPNMDTGVITMVVLFPEDKPCKKAWAMEQPTGSGEIKYSGTTAPVIHAGGALVSWTIPRPRKGVGYFIAFNW